MNWFKMFGICLLLIIFWIRPHDCDLAAITKTNELSTKSSNNMMGKVSNENSLVSITDEQSIVTNNFNALKSSRVSRNDRVDEKEDSDKVTAGTPATHPCDDPTGYVADRLINGSVRLYKGYHYWELYGLPDKVGYLKGPFDIWYEHFAPIEKGSAVMTVIQGEKTKSFYKFKGRRLWGWNSDGKLYIGGKDGLSLNTIPRGGFDAVFFNGKQDKPLMLGFKNINVYYFHYGRGFWNIDGERNGYISGRYDENFPPDISTAFSMPADDPKDGYIAYLFKKSKYCRRPEKPISEKSCDKWLKLKELFGCNATEKSSASLGDDGSVAGREFFNDNNTQTQPNPNQPEISTKNFCHNNFSPKTFALIFLTIYFIFNNFK